MQQFNHRAGPSGGGPGGVAFPRFDSSVSEVAHRYPSTVSVATGRLSINRASALELHDLIYGSGTALRYSQSGDARAAVEKLYERDAVYSNPLLTASSGDVIKDIHSLMHQFTAVSFPTPFSIMKSVFSREAKPSWLNIAKVWSEVGEVCESDVYDGHRKIVIEHTVYLLLLPDLFPPDNSYRQDMVPIPSSASSLSLPESATGTTFSSGGPATLGSATRLLTTLARQVSLPVHTRLSFNDSGRITHHQDIWDVKDVLGLVPGVSVAQWVGSRMMARGLASAFDVYAWAVGADRGNKEDHEDKFAEMGSASRSSERGGGGNALGLQLSERGAKSRAPDNDS